VESSRPERERELVMLRLLEQVFGLSQETEIACSLLQPASGAAMKMKENRERTDAHPKLWPKEASCFAQSLDCF